MPTSKVNKNHPELREGEVFLTNALSLSGIGWKTKRSGYVAYDIYGKPIHGMFPVFVQRKELEKAGINPDTR